MQRRSRTSAWAASRTRRLWPADPGTEELSGPGFIQNKGNSNKNENNNHNNKGSINMKNTSNDNDNSL